MTSKEALKLLYEYAKEECETNSPELLRIIEARYNFILKDLEILESIKENENEVGIDLIKLLKASINGFYALFIDGRVNPIKWEPGEFIIDMKDRCFRSLTVVDALGKTKFYFKDLGKTWTLTKRGIRK